MLDPWVRPGRGRFALLLLLGVAVAVGLVATFVAGSAPAVPRAPGTGEVAVDLPAQVWGLLYLSPLIAGFGVLLIRRLTEGSVAGTGVAVGTVVLLILLLLFIYVFSRAGSFHQGTITIAPGSGGGSSSSGYTPPISNNSSSAKNGTAVPGTFVLTIPASALFLGIAGLVACVVALAFPGVISRLVDRRPPRARPAPLARSRVELALEDAGAAIDRGEDPREAVVRLYNRLLAEIAPRVGDVAPLTADEIRLHALAGLGVEAAASETLTRLFEEARYSTHPIGPSDAGRFRDAIRQVQNDILRGVAA